MNPTPTSAGAGDSGSTTVPGPAAASRPSIEDGAGSVAFLLLPVLVFVAFLDNFAQLPVLAPLAVSLGADSLLAGVILGAYSLSNLAGNVLVGPILDRRGAGIPLVAGLAATSVVLAGYAVARSPEVLLGLRLLHGATAAAIVPAVFMLAGAGAPGRVLGRMGALGAMIGVAAMAGPPLSGILASRKGIPAVYAILAGVFAMAALATVLAIGVRGAPLRRGRAARPPGPADRPEARLAALLWQGHRSGLLHHWMGGAALVFAVSSLSLLLPLGLTAAAGERATLEAGRLLGVFSVAATVVMLSLSRLRRQLPPHALMALAGGGLMVMALTLGGLARSEPGAYGRAFLLLALMGVGYGTTFPSLAAGVALRAPEGAAGRAQALFYAFFSAGAFLGPAVAGWVSRGAPSPTVGYLPAGLVTAGAGALLVLRGARREAAARPPEEGTAELGRGGPEPTGPP